MSADETLFMSGYSLNSRESFFEYWSAFNRTTTDCRLSGTCALNCPTTCSQRHRHHEPLDETPPACYVVFHTEHIAGADRGQGGTAHVKSDTGRAEGGDSDIASIASIKSRIADTCILVLAVLSIPHLGFSLVRYFTIGWYNVFLLHAALAISYICAALFRARLPYWFRVALLVASPLLIGVGALFTFGLSGLATGFLISVSVLAATFFSMRAGIGIATACGLIILGTGLLATRGVITYSLDLGSYTNALSSWLNAAFGVFIGGVALALITGTMHGSIIRLLERNAARAAELEETNRRLEDEIERREAVQSELARTRSYLDGVVNSMPSMLIGVDIDGAILTFNKAAESRAEMSALKAHGKKIAQVFPFLAGQVEGVIAAARKGETLEKRRVEESYRESRRIVNITGYPLKDSVAVRGAVIRIDDVTRAEKIDEHIRQSQKMETVGNLAGGIAHDLNNMLGVMLASVNLLQRITSMENLARGEEVVKYQDLIRDSCLQAANLTGQLVGLSRKQETTLVPVDLRQSIEQVVALCRNSFPPEVEIQTLHADGSAFVLADRSQLQQVILNLCINASHAVTVMRGDGEPRGGVIVMETAALHADTHVCATHPDAVNGTDYYIARISDNGVGMPPGTVSRVFDPFFTTKKEGTGLGLSVAYSIIKKFGGFIDLYSYPGRGTTVNVYLPAGKNSGAASRGQAPLVQGTGRLLVIDDDPVIRNIAAGILAECGYDVSATAGGAEGLDLIAREPGTFSGVLLDMSMPGMSGLDAIGRIRELSPGMPVLLSSGLRLDDALLKNLEEIGIPFIQKPYNAGNLSARIRDIITVRKSG